jgi:hypothetical protein
LKFGLKLDFMSEDKIVLVSACGLYCANCIKFKKKKCLGCKLNAKATWCKIRTCCIENKYLSCAECNAPIYAACKKFNNPIGQLFGFIFNSDREAGIQLIKDEGYEGFETYLTEIGRMAIPRK